MSRIIEIVNKIMKFEPETIVIAFATTLQGMEDNGADLNEFFEQMKIHDKEIKEHDAQGFSTTSIDLKQMEKVKDSKEYEDVFLELDKKRKSLKTGSDVADEIQRLTKLPRDECMRLMTAYALRK